MAKRGLIRIEILPTAKADLKEIVDFIAQGSKKYANLEKQLIIDAINRLSEFPNLGKPFDYKSTDARQIAFRNYLIIYRFKSGDQLEY